MFVIRKIWCALFSCYLRFKIRYFALSPTKKGGNKRKVVLKLGFRSLRPVFLKQCFRQKTFTNVNVFLKQCFWQRTFTTVTFMFDPPV